MQTYKWGDLSKAQQNTARRIRDELAEDGWGVSVSQVAKHFDQAMAWRRSRDPGAAAALTALCNGIRLDPPRAGSSLDPPRAESSLCCTAYDIQCICFPGCRCKCCPACPKPARDY